MKTTGMKRILAEKLADEGTGFKYSDISITRTPMSMTTEWDEEIDDFKTELVDAIKVVIKGFEHIHFFLVNEESDYFGKEVWVWRKAYYPEDDEYSKEGGEIITDSYSKSATYDDLIGDCLVKLGYYIGSRF